MNKKWKRAVVFLLLTSLFLTILSSCKNNNGTEEPTTEIGTFEPTPNGGDTWVDNWDMDTEFTELVDDAALDTNGTEANGSWFDSFKRHVMFWKAQNMGIETQAASGAMKITAAATTDTATKNVSRMITASKNYEVEFKMRLDYSGLSNGVYVQNNQTRTTLYIYESKIRVNHSTTTGNSHLVYVDIGNDWHTYKLVGSEGIVSLYMDGAFLLSFEANVNSSSTNEISFFAAAINEFSDCVMTVEYVSYRVLDNKELSITSPVSRQVFSSDTTQVEVACSLSDALKASGSPVEFYLNNVYAGSVTADSAKMTFSSLVAGVYQVYVKCGDVISENRIFTIKNARTEEQVNSLLSTAEKLESSYILRYRVNGDGSVVAGDGMSRLTLQYTGNTLTYTASDGNRQIGGGKGEYIAVVDGGVAYLYKDGKLILSYAMPYGKCETVAKVSGAVADLTVESHNATLFKRNCTAEGNFNGVIGTISDEYALEFEYTKGKAASILLCDGIYMLSINIGADGIARGMVAPQMEAHSEVLFQAAEGTALYRVYVSYGIAQIYINNVWVKSLRLPTTIVERKLTVNGVGVGTVQIRETNDRFFFSADADEASWYSFFKKDNVDLAYCLKTYSQETVVSADLEMCATPSGAVYLVARYDGLGRGIIAGYDFTARCFKMGTTMASLTPTGFGSIDSNVTKMSLKLIVEGNTAVLYCNGNQVGRLVAPKLDVTPIHWYGNNTIVNGWANVGYINTLSGANLLSFAYEGDSNVVENTATHYLPDDFTVAVVELNGKIYVCGGSSVAWESDDNGITFEDSQSYDVLRDCSYNVIVLKSGNVLTLKRKLETNGYLYYAYVYKPDGKTLIGSYQVQEAPNTYRFTMNCKVMQTSDGRIVFVSGETENENIGGLMIYYTDREGYMWKSSKSVFNQQTTGLNLQEGCVVELEAGHLRMYARSDCGFLYYTDSYDNGVTWSMNFEPSNFASVVSAFNVVKDPVSGAIYMAWEYNNCNDNTTVQLPRSRIGLAVSYDNAKSWYYIGDMDDANHTNYNSSLHMNIGIAVTSDAVYVTASKRSTEAEDRWYNYMVRIDKDRIVPLARFNELHSMRRVTTDERDSTAEALPLAGTLLISSDGKQAYASGTYYDISGVNGKRTMLSAEIIASFMSGTLTYRADGAAVITVGKAEYVFVSGSTTALINGKKMQMIFAACAEDGTVKVSIEDLDNLLGLTAKKTEAGGIVLAFGDVPMNPESLFVNAGL